MIRILKWGEVPTDEIFSRSMPLSDVRATVEEIISNVRANGDAALKDYARRFDNTELDSIAVTEAEFEQAMREVDPAFIRVLEKAAANIRAFHSHQVRSGFIMTGENGVVMGQRIIPVDRAGLYVPGGTAAYPSTVLMDAIPAKIAGVREVVMVTPARNGRIAPVILAAARIAGIDRVYRVGGAQAIAALAYGTETIPRVDKIVGPGNAFVAEAKKQVSGIVGIDMIAGPSEILVISDGSSNPAHLAADLLSQAEHDKNASAVLVTDSEELALKVQAEIEDQLPRLAREDIARASIEANGKIIIAPDILCAVDISNEIAPEHLELCVESPFDLLDRVRHAGSIFMGRNCPEALGDYLSGANHTLPTSGTARFSSPLGVDDFIKKTQFTYYTRTALSSVAEDIGMFACREGLTGHARSALIRTAPELMPDITQKGGMPL